VAFLVATPALLFPELAAHSTEVIVFLTLMAGILTFVEYNAPYPSVVAFRDAPPVNRTRVLDLF